MDSKLQGSRAIDTDSEIDQVAIEYKLKMLAFQNEIFQARKKLSESDYRISRISENMDEYLRNKENQLAEVMLTARMNAQRIEAQARSQVEYFLLEMEDEAHKKQKDLEIFEKKAVEKGIALNDLRGAKAVSDTAERLTVVKDQVRASQPPSKKTEIEETPAVPEVQIAQPEAISSPGGEVGLQGKGKETPLTELLQVRPTEVAAASPEELKPFELVQDQALPADDDQAAISKEADRAKVEDKTPVQKKRKFVGKKSKSHLDKQPEISDAEEAYPEDRLAQSPAAAIDAVDARIIETESPEYIPQPDQQLEEIVYQPPAPAVPNETMRLDAFLDVRYYDQASDNKQIQHHALQITIDVEVPEDTYAVRYTKVNSDIVSALLRYDNVVLNEVFPFDFIAPHPQSIATYFYNYIEDILSMMDLGLQSITVLEIPDVQIQITSRNNALDNMMHKDTDEFVALRESLRPCVEKEPEESIDLKGRLNKMFKKRGL